MRCQSASARSTIDTFCIAHADALLLHLPAILIFSECSCYCRWLLIHQTNHLLKLCVFPPRAAPPGTLLHTVVLHQLSDARGRPSVSRSPPAATQSRRLCVFAPGSLSARGRAAARAFPSALLIIPLAN